MEDINENEFHDKEKRKLAMSESNEFIEKENEKRSNKNEKKIVFMETNDSNIEEKEVESIQEKPDKKERKKSVTILVNDQKDTSNNNLRKTRIKLMDSPENHLKPNSKYRQVRAMKERTYQMRWIKQVNSNPISNEELKKRQSTPYTIEEVKKHNKKDDCWMIFDGIVYDVTEYLNYHPGGKAILLPYAGKDATSVFYKFHPWVDCSSLLKNYTVGSIVQPTSLDN